MTSEPDNIPQDVQEAAGREVIKFVGWLHPELAASFARAIMAERERCAKVSEAFGDAIAIAGPSGEFLSIVPYVAGAIRSGLPAETVKSLLQKGQLTPEKA